MFNKLRDLKDYFSSSTFNGGEYIHPPDTVLQSAFKEVKNTNIAAPNKDITELLRKKLGGINFSNSKDLLEEGLTEKDKKELYAQAHLLHNNKAFQKICEFLINKQGNFTVKEAVNDSQVFFGRATINGIELFKEEVERLEGLYLEGIQGEEKFDKNDLI